MASTRNNSVQDRRAALRDQQKREREAADAVFKLLEAEEKARLATAAGVAKLVTAAGKDRAADVLGLKPAEVTAYLTLDREENAAGTDEAKDSAGGGEGTQGEDTAGNGAAGGIPAQSDAAPAPAGV